jgi:hypothetical protein
MKAGIFWLKQGGLHPASHHHLSLSLGKVYAKMMLLMAIGGCYRQIFTANILLKKKGININTHIYM